MEQAHTLELFAQESNPTPKATPRLEGDASDIALEGNGQYVYFTLQAWGFKSSLTFATLKQFSYLGFEIRACHSISVL